LTRIPHSHNEVEVRQAFQRFSANNDILSTGASGNVLIGQGVGVYPVWTTELTALTKLTIDNITIDAATILSDTGAISFGDENLTTTGQVNAGDLIVDNITIDAATTLSDT